MDGEQYEALFNEMFTNRGHTADEFNQLYTRLVDGRYVADIQTATDAGMETHTVVLNNAASKAFLREAMTGTVTTERETYGSDTLDEIDATKIADITIRKLERPRNRYQSDGAYFPYLNTTDIDLSRYQKNIHASTGRR